MIANLDVMQTDYIIVGGGIAGASIGFWLAPHGRVVLLERETQPGYHSTGRSAALFMESYGTPQVRALTMASRAFLETPPEGFAEHPLLTPRGALMVGGPGQEKMLDEHWAMLRAMSPLARRFDRDETCAFVPVFKPERVCGSVLDPDASDMDVHAIHQGYLRGMRKAGGSLVCDAEATTVRREGNQWLVGTGEQGPVYAAPVLINAAGAWGDRVAALAGVPKVELQPRRRSAFTFSPPEDADISKWPMCVGVDESEGWYIKPDAGVLLGSPANADSVDPQDVQPEEMDIALAMHRIEEITSLKIRRPLRTWAGLRSFVRDGDLIGGFAPNHEGFFWLVAQGGYGIQTSAAMGEACAALVRGLPLPERIAGFGLTEAMLSPARLS